MTGHLPHPAATGVAPVRRAAPVKNPAWADCPGRRSAVRVASTAVIGPLAIVAVPALLAGMLAGCAAPRPSAPATAAPSAQATAERAETLAPGATRPPGAARPPGTMPGADRPATRLAVLGRLAVGGDLAVFDDSARVAAPGLPAGDVAWISANAGGCLLATTADGRLFVGVSRAVDPTPGNDGTRPRTGGPGDGPGSWREVVPDFNGRPPDAPLSFGTLSPDGRLVAALAADFAAGTSVQLVVADVTTGPAASIRVHARPDGAAPAWLPDGHLLLIGRDPASDATGIMLADLTRPSAVRRLEREAHGVAVSADGRVAAIARPDGRISAGGAAALLGALIGAGATNPAGNAPPEALVEPPIGTVLGAFALDPSGTRLAAAWLDEAGGPASVWRYRLDAAGVVAEGPVSAPAGASTAVVAWLP
ncbi:MAG: hypothetical protein MUC54_07410 [Chloroflexi bacterium]|nr:hypothetical protein [Chloroflexota bacterium]